MAQRFFLCMAICAAVFAHASAHAAVTLYPTKTVRIVVPSRPVGSADAVARLLSRQLGEAWESQVVIDHRPGPGGKIGAETVAKAAADGYTLLLAGASLATAPALYRGVRYDPSRDLLPVAGVASSPFLIAALPALPVRSVKDLIALAKKGPGPLLHGCPGAGSEEHLCGELFAQMVGIRLTTVNFDSRAESLSALIGGRVPFVFTELPRGLPHVKAGKVRAIAVTSAGRSPMLPAVPAVSEALPGYECSTWLALFAPANTPAEVRAKVAATTARVVQSAEARERLRAEGLYAYPGSSEDFARFFRAELPKWNGVARASRLELE